MSQFAIIIKVSRREGRCGVARDGEHARPVPPSRNPRTERTCQYGREQEAAQPPRIRGSTNGTAHWDQRRARCPADSGDSPSQTNPRDPLTTIPEPPHALLPDVGTQSRMNPPPRSSTSHARANNGARAPAVRPLSGDRAAAVSRPRPPCPHDATRASPPPRSGRRLCARDRRARDGPPSRARGSAREQSAHRRSARRLR